MKRSGWVNGWMDEYELSSAARSRMNGMELIEIDRNAHVRFNISLKQQGHGYNSMLFNVSIAMLMHNGSQYGTCRQNSATVVVSYAVSQTRISGSRTWTLALKHCTAAAPLHHPIPSHKAIFLSAPFPSPPLLSHPLPSHPLIC